MTNFGTIWNFYVLDDLNYLTYFCVELYVSVFLFANYYRMLWINKENISNKTKVTHNFKIREGGRVFVATRVHDFHCRGADSILGLSWVCWLSPPFRGDLCRHLPLSPLTLNQYLNSLIYPITWFDFKSPQLAKRVCLGNYELQHNGNDDIDQNYQYYHKTEGKETETTINKNKHG